VENIEEGVRGGSAATEFAQSIADAVAQQLKSTEEVLRSMDDLASMAQEIVEMTTEQGRRAQGLERAIEVVVEGSKVASDFAVEGAKSAEIVAEGAGRVRDNSAVITRMATTNAELMAQFKFKAVEAGEEEARLAAD
jgi:methyl-accepting chemotaxis protein